MEVDRFRIDEIINGIHWVFDIIEFDVAGMPIYLLDFHDDEMRKYNETGNQITMTYAFDSDVIQFDRYHGEVLKSIESQLGSLIKVHTS